MDEKERLELKVLEYLRTWGYSGVGPMSRMLGASCGRVKRALGRLLTEDKIEARVYAGMRTYRVRD